MKYSTHSRYVNKDDIEVPSATTILKILNKPSLIKWANYLGFKRENVQNVLDESSYIGEWVHLLIYVKLMNKMLIANKPRGHTKQLIAEHYDNFLLWIHDSKEENIEPIFMEKKFVSEEFGGTVDYYGLYNGKKTIIDFKTTKAFYSSMFLQLAAYTILLEENDYEVEQVGILRINKDKYAEKFISREELEPYIETFKSLIKLFHKWYNLNMDNGWGDVLGK